MDLEPVPRGELDGMLEILGEAAVAVNRSLETVADRRRAGSRPGQYALDLVADEAILSVLHREGFAVLSEESGLSGPADADFLVVADPVDGSTNASLGIPWYATSLCVLDAEGPLVALVVDQASGVHYEAVRGSGARRNGRPISPSDCASLRSAVVGISGFPPQYPGWSQFRALGAASLDICLVAEGVLDAYRVVGRSALSVWDYVGAVLVCTEAGAVVGECDGEELVVRDRSHRRPVVAATRPLYEALAAAPL